MVKEGIVLGRKIFKKWNEVDKAKFVVIAKFSPPVLMKGIQSFLEHTEFFCIFIKYFSKIAHPL